MKALIRVSVKRRPVSDEIIGLRLQATVPNLAARKMVKTTNGFAATETLVPSFRKPYLITESGDSTLVTEGDLERFKQRLGWEGFKEFELLTNLNGGKIEAMTPEVQAKIDHYQALVNAQAAASKIEEAPF